MNVLSLFAHSPFAALIFLIGVVAAVSVHEFAHAWTAYRLGDSTPYLDGRVTLNPLAHLDPFGSLAFLLLGFGWGRPVLYNPSNLTRRYYELLIALAGPVSNLLFATAVNVAIFFTQTSAPGYAEALGIISTTNLFLAAFNLIPLPPLDGSSIIAYFWPNYRSLIGSQIGSFIILALVFLTFLTPFNPLNLILQPVLFFFKALTHLFGLI